jgi:creatinine amidohydrolase
LKISEMNWSQVESYLAKDDRAVLPTGSTEQHAQLSLAVDSILAERVSLDAAAAIGVPVFPTVNYGLTPYFMAFPGTVTLKVETFMKVIGDILDSLAAHGFKRIVIVNGHGGNAPAQSLTGEWMAARPGVQVKFHNWYNAPKTWKKVKEIDPVASHASWMENFPWTRLANAPAPEGGKQSVEIERIRQLSPQSVRSLLGDGNLGGLYQRQDEEMMALWQVAVDETREVIETGWM